MKLKLFQEIFYGDFLQRRSFSPFYLAFGAFHLVSGRDWKGYYYQTSKGGCGNQKSIDTGGIADRKAGKDGMEIVFFQVSSPFCVGSDLKLH